jgi:hypothetical protein
MTQHISYINLLDEQIIPSIITMENDYVNCVDSYILKNRVIHVRILDNNSTNTELVYFNQNLNRYLQSLTSQYPNGIDDDDLLPLIRRYINNVLKNSKQINEAINKQKTIQIYIGTFCPLKYENNNVQPMPGIFRP